MANQKVTNIYNLLSENGLTKAKDVNEFSKWMAGSNYRQNIYGLLKQSKVKGIGSGYGEFTELTGYGKRSSSPQTQQAKDVGSGYFGSPENTQNNVPSSISRQDNYTRPGSLVEQLNQRDKEAEEAITKPLRETAKKVQNRQFTPQKVQYVDENDNVVDEDEVYPIMPKETAEDELNRMAYDRLQAVNNTDIDAQIAALDKETRDIFQNSVDNYKRGKKPKSIWERMADVGTTNAMPSGTREYMEMVDAVGGNPEYKNRVAALNLLKQASYMKRAAEQSKKTNVENKKGIGDWVDDTVGWFKDAAFGAKEAAKNVSTWDMGATAATDAKALYDAAQKFDNGEKLSESEQQLLNAAATYSAFENAYSKDVGSGVKAGQITVEALPFMAEMLANPASGTGKALQKKFVSKGMTELVKGMVKSIAKKQGRKAAAKELAKGTLARVGGDLLGAAVMAGTTGAEGVAGDTYRRMQGQSQYGVDENGNIQYSGREENEENPLVAAAKAFGARTIENHSEMVGAYFGPVLGVAGEAVAKGLSKMKLGGVVDFIKSMGATKGAKLVDNFFEKTKWDGTIGEYAEEVVGGIENALVVGDQTLDTDPETGVFNGEQNLETFLSVALMGGFMSSLHTGAGAWSYAKGKQQLNRADYLASESLGDKWSGIKQEIDKSTDADVSKNLNQILSDNSLSDEQKAAVREYAKRKETLRGVLYGEEARKKERAQEKAATRPSNIDVADDGQTVVQTNQNGEVIGEEKFGDEEEAKAHADMLKMQRTEQDFQDDLAMAIEASEQRRQAVENGTPDDFPLSDEMEARVRAMAMNQIIPEGVEEGSPEYETFVKNMDTPGTAENDILLEMMDSFDPLEDTYETVALLEDSDRDEIDKAIKTDPVKRTERQQKLVSEVAWRLHMYNYPKGELHPEQSFTDGQTQADLDGAGTEYAMPENMVHAREDMEEAQTALDDAMAQNSELAGYVNETINANEPMSPEDIVAGMVGRFSDEERRVVCDFINAQSRLQGYLDFTDKKMRQFVNRETSKRAFKGTLNGAQQENMVMVSDGEHTYFLVGGDVSTDENGTPTPSLPEGRGAAQAVVVVDEDGNIMPISLDASLTIMPGQTYDDYSAGLLQQMQVKTTADMGYQPQAPTEQPSPNPSEEGNAEAQPQPTDNGAQPAAEAGQEQTGANETAGAAPVAPAGEPAGTGAEMQQAVEEETTTPPAQEIPTDKEGVKLYEQGVNVDDAIGDIQNDGFDPAQYADLAINEAQTELSKMKEPKTRADLVKNNARRKELQNTIDYYTSLKERYSAMQSPQQETEQNVEGEENVNVPEVENNESGKELSLQEQIERREFKGRTADERRRARIEALKAFYGDLFDDDFSYAQTPMELASMFVGRNRMLSRESLESELGYPLGINTDEAWAETLLAKKGEGKTTKEVAHAAWESSENPIVDEKTTARKFDDKEIHDALLELFRSADNKSDVIDYYINSREEAAKRALEGQKRAAAEGVAAAAPLTAAEIEEMEATLPFAKPVEGEDIPDSPITQLAKAVAELSKEEGMPEIGLVDTDRMSDDDWYEMASAIMGGAFIEQEEVDKVRDYVLENGVFYSPQSGITVYSDSQTAEDVREKVKQIKDYINDRVQEEGRNDREDTIVRRHEEGTPAVEAAETPAEGANGAASRGEDEEVEDLDDPEGIGSRISEDGETVEEPSANGTVYKQGYLIDGKHKVTKVDEPDAKRNYTGSYNMFDGKRYGDLNEIVREIDSRAEGKPSGTVAQQQADEYLQPRNAEEEAIVKGVIEQLQQEIDAAVKERDKAASALEKARAKESDKATDMFSDDNAFKQEGQLFDSSEMPTDRSQEGVNRRTSAERERLNEAQDKLNKLQSEQERNSRIRGALDNERRQTRIRERQNQEREKNTVPLQNRSDEELQQMKKSMEDSVGGDIKKLDGNKEYSDIVNILQQRENERQHNDVKNFIEGTIDDGDVTFVDKLTPTEFDKLNSLINENGVDDAGGEIEKYVKSLREKYPVEQTEIPSGEPEGTAAPSMEEIKDATGVEEPKKEGKNPSGNKLVTDERYEELKKRMRDKLLGQMNVGVDPEILAIGVEMAVYHIEKGARKFADFARDMIEDLGDVIRPYLKAFYNGARDLPEMEELSKEMDDYGTVQSFDVANFDKTSADPMEQAKEIRDEAKVNKDVQKAKENIKVVAKENNKKKKNISSQQEAAKQQQDLFNLNTEEDDNIRRTDDGRTEGLQTDGNIGEVDNSGNRQEAQQETQRPDGGREEGRDRGLGDGLHDGLRPDDHVEETEAEPQPHEKKNQRNNRNERGKDYAPTSATARVKANIAAIKLLKQLEAEDRDATPEEMDVLKQYSGWGGLGGAFNENSPYYNEVRDVLDDAEYDSAAMSINSAYYTPASVIDRLWDVATKLGFKGGNILESSAGIGNIIASIPESMNERSNIEMVEIDSISGRILAKLYPDAKVNIKGFEDTRIENGSVDLAITNVPFVTGLKVRDEVDTDLSRQFGNIHDFVIAKNIRKLKEGGIGIFITTSNTLDKSDSLREWIDGKGDTDVMGVFRLNNETFGGTKVTSDIIVVRKRVNGERHPDAIDVMQSSVIRDGEYENQDGKYDWKAGKYETKRTSMRVNNYLNEHPEDMGGEMAFGYEKGDTFRPGSYGLYPSEKNQEQLLDAWVQKMKNVFAAAKQQPTVKTEDTTVREGRMFVKDGKIYVSQQGKAVPYAAKKAKVKGKSVEECVKDYVAIRESLGDVLKYQLENESDKGLKPLLDKLNKAYDDFVKKYGYLHKNVAISFLRDDIEFPDIAALENYSESKDIEGNKIVRVGKSKVFEGRVLRFKTEPKPQTVKDGVLASVQQFGKIDLGWIAQNVPGQTEASVRTEILNSGYGFEDPVTKKVEVRYEYLSGNVREKLRQARENNTDGRYNKNIEALEKVLPMDIPAHLIDFSLGSSWIDPKLYEDFVNDKYGCTVRLVNVGGTWSMEVLRGEYDEKNRAGGVHSELLGDTIPASKLFEAAINNRTYKVQRTFKDWDGSKHTETDKAATQACQNRIGEIKDEFNEWAKGRMQTDVEMAEKMMRVYNDKFNSMVPKEVDDTFVPEQFEGAVDYIHLYPHQSKAVMRAVTEPVMLAHQVGAGKTFTLITTAMEMRRLGTAKKPMIVVQNATVGQFVAAAKVLYPNAKILSLTERDRDAEGRRSFYGKIKYNDWDMIVIPQSTFERIPDSPERQEEFIQEKIDDKLHALEAARKAKADDRLVKQMEREIDDLEQERDDIALGREPQKGKKGKKKDEEKNKKNTAARAKEQLDRHADDVMYFDDMGIDALLIDEAHEYKRLGFSTTMGRGVKGIDPAGSKKAAGVYLKTRGILKNNGWKNVVFATGTPISNTAAEIWTFMKYLMPKESMMEQEIWYFDDFVHNFGKVAQSLEFATNGKFKENTRFAAYINKPELIRIWSTVADTVLAKDMPSVAEKLPEKENGKDQDVFLPQTQSLIGIMRAVRKKLEEFEKMSGAEKRANSSVPLVMYGLAKRAAIDPRLVDAGAMDEPNSKTNKATDEIVKDLAATDSYKGTVAVFCDMQNGPEGFNIFQEMKRKLMEKGVPENKIAIITSGMTITQKEKIFEQVNSGDIRVIMGSTQTLGTGVNIQERLHLLIHMDAPDRPMDYTQRNGRILRQGNLHKEWGRPIRILRFGVEDSLDVTSYQRLKTKSGFIDSIMDGKGALANNQVDRTLEEEEEGLFDNPVAVLSGSQYALKKTQAERELRKWQSKKQQWEADQIYIENTIRRNNGQNKEAEERIKEYDNQIELAKKHFPDGKAKTITVKGVETKNEEELQKALSEQVGKPIRERVEKYRNDRTFTGATVKIPMKFDDVNVVVEVDIERETEYVQGKGLKTTMHTIYRYNIPELGIDEYSIPRGFIKDIVNDIKEDISAQTTIDRREFAQKGIEKRTADNEQLEARRSPTFKDEDKLESARKKVDEYTEEMRKEMAEKEAKYAAMDAEDVDLDAIEDNAEEEDDDSGTRLREIANNSQSSLRNNLESEVSESESVPLSERPLRTFTDYNGNVHEGLEEELQSLLSQERGGNRGKTEGTGEASEAAAARSSAGVAERYARVTALRDEISRREKAREELRRKYNIDEKGNISLEDVARMFRDVNTNKTLGELFDKVYAVLKTISPNFRFTDNFKQGESGAAFMETAFYDWDTFARRENGYLAHVLLHEMIHNVTSHILLRYEKPSYGSLTREQKRIAKEITELYEYVKKEDPRWQNGTKPYGLDNAQEMVAELANPDFRKLLDSIPYKGTTILQRLKALIREIFGLKNDTALDRLSRAADRLIDSFDENMAYEYRRIRRETESSIRAINPNIDYVDFLENYGLDWGDAKLVEDADLINELENGEKVTVYRAMQLQDGKLYPPMAAKVNGKWQDALPLGQWSQADEHPELVNKNGKFNLDKGNGKMVRDVVYAPYMHGSTTMLNDQFKEAQDRPELVVVEAEMPASELTSGYQAEKSPRKTGMLDWKAGTIQGQLTGTRQVMLSRWVKPIRIVPSSEVAASIKEMIDGQVEVMPTNVVTPEQREELEKLGVKFVKTDNKEIIQEGEHKGEQYSTAYGKKAKSKDARRKTDGNGGTRLREGSAATESQPAEKMKEHLTKLSKKIGVKVVFHDDASTVNNAKAKASLERDGGLSGWFDPKDNSVHFYMPNIKDRYEAEKTIWHEVVGHKGMMALLGEEGYRTFMRRLWMDKSPAFEEMHQWVVQNYMRYGGNLYETMDEWFAYNVVEPSVPKTLWDKVMQVMGDVLRKLGFMNTPNMKDMKYMLWLSKNAIKEGDAWSELQRNALLAKLDLETRRRAAAYSKDAARARDGFTNTPTGETERQMYKNGLMRKMFAWTEAHQDYMASAKLLMDAILKGRSVLDKFNFYMKENHSDSKIKIAEDQYVRDFCKPMEDAINKCIAAIGGRFSEAYEILEDYMAMKHGLERNREFFVRDWLEDKRKKTPTVKDLDEEAKRDFESAARGIYQAFEDGQIETEEERDSELRKALQDSYSSMLDRIENGWAATKSQPTDNLAEWLKGLDDYIREHIDEEYNPNEHDYSGLTSFNANVNANLNDNDDYDDDAVIGYVMDMEGKMGKENVDELWKQKERMTQFALDIEHEAGLITDKNYEKVSQMFHWYMPLRKWDEDMAEDIWSYMNTKKSTYVGNTLMKAKGRKSRAEMPIGTMFAMGGNAIVRAARNEVKKSFAGFVRKYEKPGEDALVTELDAWVENLGTEENPDWVYSFPDIPEGASQDDIIQAKAEWAQHMLDLMQEGRAKRVIQGDSIPYRFENKKRSRPEHIVEVYEDGRPHFFIVNDNPRAAQAINGKLKPETKHKMTAKVNRFMSSVFTSYSPTFMARNAFRDAEFASSMLSVKEGWDYCQKFMKNYVKVTNFAGKRPLMFTLFRKFRDGTLDDSNKMERYFKEFAENGGITGYVMENNAERWEKEILAGVKEIGENKVVGITKNIVKKFMEGVEHAGEAIENAARFATYVTSREDGRTITKSVNDAKEVSVNFNRKGAGYKTESLLNDKGEKTTSAVWAAKTAQYMRANTLFYNASLQGIVNSVGNAVRKPWWFAAKFAIPPMVMGALIPVFNAWVHAMLDDDDDKVSKDPYADLPEYTRRMNMCLYIGHGKFLMIPLSIEHRAFFGLGDIMAGQTYDERLKSVDYPFAVDAVRQMTAFSPVDYNSKETGVEGVTGWGVGIITPAPISPLVNAYFNKSWTGSQIQRENAYGGSNLPEYQKAKDYTNKRLIGASKWWHELWGGDEAVRAGRNDDNKYKEWIGEISPAKMEYVVEQYFGEPGKIGTGVSDMYSMIFGDKDADLRKIPIVKAFMTLPNDNTQFRRANTKYWRYRDEFKEVEQDDRQYRARIETNPDLKLEYENKFKKTKRYKQWKLYDPGKGGEGFKYKKTIEDLQKRINAEDDPVQKKGLTQEKNAYVQELVELLDGVE